MALAKRDSQKKRLKTLPSRFNDFLGDTGVCQALATIISEPQTKVLYQPEFI